MRIAVISLVLVLALVSGQLVEDLDGNSPPASGGQGGGDIVVEKRETSQPEANTTAIPATPDGEALAGEPDAESGLGDAVVEDRETGEPAANTTAPATPEEGGAAASEADLGAEGGRDIVVEKRETRGPRPDTATPPTIDRESLPGGRGPDRETEPEVSERENNGTTPGVPSNPTIEDDPGTVQGDRSPDLPGSLPDRPGRPNLEAEDDGEETPYSIDEVMEVFANDTAGNVTASTADEDDSTSAAADEGSGQMEGDETEPETTSDDVSSNSSSSATTDATSSLDTATGGGSTSQKDPEKVSSDDDSAVGTNATEASTATTNQSTNEASNGTGATGADATEGSTNGTASEEASTTAGTTTPTTTTTTEEPLPPIIAKVRSSVKISNHDFEAWMSLQITQQFKEYSSKLTSIFLPVLQRDMGPSLLGLKIVSFTKGSVVVHMDVTLQTNTSNISAVDTEAVASEVRTSLQQVIETGDMAFDPSAVTADADSIELIAPTEPPPSLEVVVFATEELYESSFMRFEMRAPNANYTEDYNKTDSAAFKELEADIDQGVKAMLIKKYPSPTWNVTSTLLAAWNDTTKGVGVSFEVEIQPQWANTTETVGKMAQNYVYFSRIGTLQIDPSSVVYQDLTTYAPGEGMVVKGNGYMRELNRARFNGSYVGDYTTPRPTLQPIVKRHQANIMAIALPAFLGMLSALGLLLICTTIAQGKKSVD